MDYQAKLQVPFGVLGIQCNDEKVTGIPFLAPSMKVLSPTNAWKGECKRVQAYKSVERTFQTYPHIANMKRQGSQGAERLRQTPV